ncbi:histidinol-phosphate transaminase [Lachnospiraceae bacterium YH-ros2228]
MSYFLLDEFKQSMPYQPGEMPKDREYLKLNANESSYPPSPKVLDAMTIAAVNSVTHYCDPHYISLRSAIGSIYDLDYRNVFVGNGADEVLSFALMSFFRRGMKVCFPDITYDFYRTYAVTYGLDYKQFPLREDYTIDVDDYIDTDRDVILANPNNPTGQALSVNEIERIVAANSRRMVLVDEAYVDYGMESCVPLIRKYSNLIIVQTFSKSRNMPGARIGFALAQPGLIDDMERVKFSFNPFNISTLAIAGGRAAALDQEYTALCVGKVKYTREWFEDELEKLGFHVYRTETNFVFFQPKGIRAADLTAKLKAKGILVRYYNEPRLNTFVRITIGTEIEMEHVLVAIRQIIGVSDAA